MKYSAPTTILSGMAKPRHRTNLHASIDLKKKKKKKSGMASKAITPSLSVCVRFLILYM